VAHPESISGEKCERAQYLASFLNDDFISVALYFLKYGEDNSRKSLRPRYTDRLIVVRGRFMQPYRQIRSRNKQSN